MLVNRNRSIPMQPPYVLPDSAKVEALEFDWDPYEGVWFFTSALSLAAAAKWFEHNLPPTGNANPDEGKLEFYFADDDGNEWSILVSDAGHRPAVADLNAYVGSTRLEKRTASLTRGVVVVVFKHRPKPARPTRPKRRR